MTEPTWTLHHDGISIELPDETLREALTGNHVTLRFIEQLGINAQPDGTPPVRIPAALFLKSAPVDL